MDNVPVHKFLQHQLGPPLWRWHSVLRGRSCTASWWTWWTEGWPPRSAWSPPRPAAPRRPRRSPSRSVTLKHNVHTSALQCITVCDPKHNVHTSALQSITVCDPEPNCTHIHTAVHHGRWAWSIMYTRQHRCSSLSVSLSNIINTCPSRSPSRSESISNIMNTCPRRRPSRSVSMKRNVYASALQVITVCDPETNCTHVCTTANYSLSSWKIMYIRPHRSQSQY